MVWRFLVINLEIKVIKWLEAQFFAGLSSQNDLDYSVNKQSEQTYWICGLDNYHC